MRAILLPTDFSDHSKNAIRYALHLFKEAKDHRFILMNAYYMPYSGAVMMSSIEDVMQKSASEEMAILVQLLHEEFPVLKERLSSEVIHGDPFVVMQNMVAHNGIDLIVMGTTGASGLKAALVGSVTAQVVKRMNCSVLAIPAKTEFRMPKCIALAADNNEVQEAAFEPLMEIIEYSNAKVLVFSVMTNSPESDLNNPAEHPHLHKTLEKVQHEFLPLKNYNLESGILEFVEENACDMLVMVHHNYGIIEQLFHKSATKQLALHTNVPLLVLQEPI